MSSSIAAVDVVAQDPAALGVLRGRRRSSQVAGRAERGDLDDVAAEAHMRKPEPPADQPGSSGTAPCISLRMGVGDDVEIFRVLAEQQVADAAADQ